MRINRQHIWILSCLAVLAVALLGAINFGLNNHSFEQKNIGAQSGNCFIFAASRNLPIGTKLSRRDFDIIKTTSYKIPSDAVTNIESVLGKTTTYEIQKNEIVMFHHVGIHSKF